MENNEVVVNGFSVVPTKVTADSSVGHYLYFKEHDAIDTDKSKPKDRTLFVLNIPPYVNEACLERLFRGCGKVLAVHIHKKPTSGPPVIEQSEHFKTHPPIHGFKVGYIVFKNPRAVDRAKEMPFNEPLVLSTKEHPLKTGINKWCSKFREEHQFDSDKIQAEVDTFMEAFDIKQQEEVEQEKEDGEPDEDGWITVTRHGKNKGVPRTEVMEQKATQKQKKKASEKELLNFYAFQMRETKREHIAELRMKFEEDKSRIEVMKAQRKFKPY